METIEDRVKEIAGKGWPGYGFVIEDWAGVDREIGRTALPAIVCFLVESGSLDFRNGRCRDSEDVVLAFIDAVPKDADGYDNVQAYSKMKELAKSFIMSLLRSGYFEPLESEVRYHTLYESLADNVSGIWCAVTLKEVKGVCL